MSTKFYLPISNRLSVYDFLKGKGTTFNIYTNAILWLVSIVLRLNQPHLLRIAPALLHVAEVCPLCPWINKVLLVCVSTWSWSALTLVNIIIIALKCSLVALCSMLITYGPMVMSHGPSTQAFSFPLYHSWNINTNLRLTLSLAINHWVFSNTYTSQPRDMVHCHYFASH